MFSLFQTLSCGEEKLRGAWLTTGASLREGNCPKTASSGLGVLILGLFGGL